MKKNYFLLLALALGNYALANGNEMISTKKNDKKIFANIDVKITGVKLDKFLVVGGQTYLRATIKNVGTTSVSSIEISWTDGVITQTKRMPAYISVDQQKEIQHPIPLSFSDASVKTRDIKVTISKVNDLDDDNPADNSFTVQNSIVSQFVSKKVVIEEGTGTWCGWCPRGMVALKNVNETYPNDQISIAIHNNDPMAYGEYNGGLAFTGYPRMHVDREIKNVDINPPSVLNYVSTRRAIAAPAILSGDFSISGSQLTANANAKFYINNPNANYKMAAVVLEDNVKGTASNYGQTNYYTNNSNGEMGGYESLPSPVPASQMVYDHVARALLGGYNGQNNSVNTQITDGSTSNYTFNYTIPAEYNKNELNVVLLLIDATDGTIITAGKLSKTLAVNDVTKVKANVNIYPNPAKGDFYLKFEEDGQYDITILDMAGRIVKDYGKIASQSKEMKLDIKALQAGKYMVNISKNGTSFTKNLIIQ